MVSEIISYGIVTPSMHLIFPLMIHSNPFLYFYPWGLSCSHSSLFLFSELFYQEGKEGTPHSIAELTTTQQLRGAFSDTEDFLDHGLVSANRCSSRTSSITSWTENIKPSFTKKLKFQSVLEGEPVEFKCKLVAFPPPTILWFHNNKSIPKERRRRICTDSKMHMHITSLVIDTIKEKDSGSYKVMALNTEGSAESTASLLVSLREEQSANYLGFVKRSAKAHASMDTMAEERKERKIRVDLRCVGSPFDKMSKVHKGRSRSTSSLVRSVYFRSGSHSKEKPPEKDSKCLETASERAPSPPPMFDRSERFNDRFSDIYCDRRTGARFSDKFSDRCSDRYSERFSDTESLHNEVRTKLTTLQKAVKQKKRLSISTMSSSEFEAESVASESSYADYVERLRVKPASLPDVQHFNRPFDLGESHKEIHGKTSSSVPSQHRVRHSFEPQSRSRAIQIMRGELVDTLVDRKVESFVESRADVGFERLVSEHHGAVDDQTVEGKNVKVPYSEKLAYPETTPYTESRESVRIVSDQGDKPVTSIRKKYHSETLPQEDTARTKTREPYEGECAEESLRAQYEKSLEADRMECEEKLLALRIRKWQQGSRMSEEETFHPETDLPMPAETQYMDPTGNIYTQQDMVGKRVTVETEALPSSFHNSPRMKAKLSDPEAATVSTTKSPKVKARGEEVETSATMEARLEEVEREASLMPAQKSPRLKARAEEVEVHWSPRAKARAESRLRESPRSRPVETFKERFLGEAETPDRIAKQPVEPYEEECAGESLRAQYEKSLDAERMQCEEKLLALRIRKWQHGMRMSEEETPETETDLSMQADTQYMEPEGHIYPQQEVLEKTLDHATMSTPKSHEVKGRVEQESSAPLLKAKMIARPGELDNESSVMLAQKSPRIKARAAEIQAEESPKSKSRAEKMLFEKTKEERELQLSRENLSELKNESEKLVSEEEALTQRIMKWQQDVLMEQDVKLESNWEGYSVVQAERTTEVGRNVTEASVSDSTPQPEVVRSRKPAPGKTAKEKFLLSESVPTGVQDRQGDNLQWSPDLPTEGRETRLQRDSEYFVSEEEAMAQRIRKWQEDVVEQEEVVELESEWALDHQGKQSASGLPFESHVPPFDVPHERPLSHRTLAGGVFPTRKPSTLQHATGYDPSPPCELSSQRRHSPTQSGLPHHAGVPIESFYNLKSTPAQDECLHKPSREITSVRRSSPCLSPQGDLETEAESSQSKEKYAVNIDKSSSQHFQSEVREERGIGEEMGATRESSEWRQEKDFAGIRREERSGDSIKSKLDSNLKAGVYQTQQSKRIKEEDASAGGSRPVFVKEISSVKVKVGEMSEFTCQFNGDPLPTVTWLKDGHPLAHNPDYDIVSKSNKSQLTVYYPTTDHEGTYDCVITNRYGKSICSGTLEISDKKVVKTSAARQEVIVSEALQKVEEKEGNGMIAAELKTYMDTGKETLKVPQAVIQRRSCSDESFSSSLVEIRITAATPVPGMSEESTEDKPQAFTEKTSDVPSDDGASQTVKHKFTFSFDVVGEAPIMVRELENVTCPEGNTAVLECEITGEPAPEVSWYHDNVCLEITAGKYRVEEDNKVYRLYINSFMFTDVGVYTCVARNKLGEVASISAVSFEATDGGSAVEDGGFTPSGRVRKSPVSLTEDVNKPLQTPPEVAAKAPRARPGISREPPTISGCGLSASAAVIKVSQIKQAFESDSPVAIPPSAEEQRKEMFFPEEFIPAVAVSFDQPEQAVGTMQAEGGHVRPTAMTINPGSPKAGSGTDYIRTIPASGKSVSSQTAAAEESHIGLVSGDVEEGAVLVESYGALKQFVEEVQESPELVRPKPQKPASFPKQMEAGELEIVGEETMRAFDRTSSFIPYQCEKVSGAKRYIRTAEEAVKPKRISDPLKPKRQSAAEGSSTFDNEGEVVSMEVPIYAEGVAVDEEFTEMKKHMKQEFQGISEGNVFMEEAELPCEELISIPEPSLDSGVFLSLPDSHADVTEVAEEMVGHVVEAYTQIKAEDERKDVPVKPEPKPLIVKPKMDSSVKQPGRPEDAAAEGPQSQVASVQERGSLAKAGATASSLEEEEVTFGAVYDYYNPPTDWGRPLSPESEMSIEIGSTVSEEIAEVAERFYTPGSSTEISQPIAESFNDPKSPMSFHTPSSGTPGGFMTPQEYPFSPLEHKRPSTGDSSEMFFSPVHFLTSPADEGIETTPPGINVDENRFLTKGRGSLSLATLQEKVQGIPPAFLKPLIKKRVFENDSLTYFAEVFGLPSPEVKWFCNKTQLVADDRVKMERDGDSISLTIHNVTKADQGEYICEAVNYVGEARSVALVVVVSQEVRFMPAPPAVTCQHVMEFDVEEDDSSRSPSPQEILLEVELDENEVKEFEKQVKIITIPEYTADNKSMIISLDVLPSIYEEGTVDFVTQEHDDLKIAFEVTEMPPRFINPICDMETPEGTTVMFESSLMGIPSPIVSWFKGDKKIPHNNKKFLHSSDGDNHFLKICKVTTQDSGVYACRAINVVGETLCRATLVVLNAKAFSGKTRGRELTAVSLGSAKVQPQKFDLMVGNTSFDGEQVSEIELEFEFEQEADESQRAVRLVANTDNEMSEQGDKYVSINFDVFAEPAKDDKIEFKGKSSDMCSFQFQVTESPPKCVIPLTNVTAAIGTPVILQCLISGKPNPIAEWYKDGDRVTDSRCIIQEKTAGHFNLLITNVTQSDAGEYKCVIQNTAGCIETTALLKVF